MRTNDLLITKKETRSLQLQNIHFKRFQLAC